MSSPLTIEQLFAKLQQRLEVQWIAGVGTGSVVLNADNVRTGGVGLAGHLNLIHSNTIELMGEREQAYLMGLSSDRRDKEMVRLFSGKTKILVLAEQIEPIEGLAAKCDSASVALLCSSLKSYELLSEIQFLLAQELAEQVVLHGVFLEVAGVGVLLTGTPGVGKSELALELVTRGNRLVADDAPVFSRISPTTLSGASPELLQDFLEVRGLGVLNIRAMFGDASIKRNKYLRMIVNLVALSEEHLHQDNRLEGLCSEREILGIKVPEVTLPIAPGRDIGVLVEAAARNQVLKFHGYSAAEDFRVRLSNQINSSE